MSEQSRHELLEITDLRVAYRGQRRRLKRVIDGVDLAVGEGETVGLVGESGSGKSTIGRAVLGLAHVETGSIVLDGRDIAHLSRRRRARLAEDLQVVFQDPYSSLNPAMPIGRILREPLQVTKRMTEKEASQLVHDLLARVSLPRDAAGRYPSSFSGGQRQRIAIARALSTGAKLIVCDESVSALDVSTQAQIINLLKRLQRELGVAYLFISHDIAVVQNISDRIVVLYRGRIMEQGPADRVSRTPLHPYTRALLDAAPIPNPTLQRQKRQSRLHAAPAQGTDSGDVEVDACPFARRCPLAEAVCFDRRPIAVERNGVTVACHLYDPEAGHSRAGTPVAATAAHQGKGKEHAHRTV
ncbi:oligopeptide/dipeptide ABC transporter ATP-binding protein [Mycobacterium sp. NPDC003449]